MDNKQLGEVLTKALELANKAGVYSLQDSSAIFQVLVEVKSKLNTLDELNKINSSEYEKEFQVDQSQVDTTERPLKK